LNPRGYAKPEIEKKVAEATRILKLDDYLDRKPAALSGGQRAYSGVIRPVIPKVSGHPFRFYPAIDSGASGHPVM